MLWAIRSLLGIAAALESWFMVTAYRGGDRSFAFWYAAALTACFLLLLAFGWQGLARLLRSVVGLTLGSSLIGLTDLCSRLGNGAAACERWSRALHYGNDVLALWSPHVPALPDAVATLELALAAVLIIGVWGDGFAFFAGVFFLICTVATTVTSGFAAALATATPLLAAGSFMISAALTTQASRRKARGDDPFMLAFDEAQFRAHHWGSPKKAVEAVES
jgi:hypothetical protein